MVSIRFSVWLVSGYAHVFVQLSVVIVTLPSFGVSIMRSILATGYTFRTTCRLYKECSDLTQLGITTP